MQFKKCNTKKNVKRPKGEEKTTWHETVKAEVKELNIGVELDSIGKGITQDRKKKTEIKCNVILDGKALEKKITFTNL